MAIIKAMGNLQIDFGDSSRAVGALLLPPYLTGVGVFWGQKQMGPGWVQGRGSRCFSWVLSLSTTGAPALLPGWDTVGSGQVL